ncbi:MAG: AIR synthase-related protein [Candidatus Methanomethylicia archaeon]|nr:AIR synthase-related protein [Candidatus Methanomethylicia archaeon]
MSKYDSLGVDVEKKGIEPLKEIIDDLFPGSFCSIVQDPHDPSQGMVLHEDGAGSKPILSYICYKETGDESWFEPLAQDVIAMNIDDVICVGAMPVVFSDYIALNSVRIKKSVLAKSLSRGFVKSLGLLKQLSLPLIFAGGETADLPDIVNTFDISGSVFARVQLKKVITGMEIAPGDIIVGLRSGGRANYEEKENSGIMCNGISLVRHSLLSKQYLKKYPEIGCPAIKGYFGRFTIDASPPELGMSIGEAVLSPTRIYLPVAVEILKRVVPKAIVHNTGGGLTKCMRLGRNIKYIKDSLPEPDPIFSLIQRESREDPWQMCREFNMGIGLEVVVKKGDEEEVIRSSEKFGIQAQVIGRCERSAAGNAAIIRTMKGVFIYQ